MTKRGIAGKILAGAFAFTLGSATAAPLAANVDATPALNHVAQTNPRAGYAPERFATDPLTHAFRALDRQATSVTRAAPTNDLVDHRGPVLLSAQFHPIYINKPASHWGNPTKFYQDFTNSTFINIVNQYMRQTKPAAHRYSLGVSVALTTTATNLTAADVSKLVQMAARTVKGNGLTHMYNLFLPQGTNVCLSATSCYSPDRPATFQFCGYHGAFDFADVGHIVYSVQPFANVRGCNGPANTPNGQLADAQDSVLSHELIEAITDPNLNAWFDATGQEIGDKCQGAMMVSLAGSPYFIQREYSNAAHACTFTP